MSALLEIAGLTKVYQARAEAISAPPWRQRPRVRALGGVDLAVGRGECLAVVGESGSGKSTLGRCALRLVEPSGGSVRFDGEDLLALPAEALRRRRRRFQMVFQDALGSLDPRQSVGAALSEPLGLHTDLDRRARSRRVAELLAAVGLPAALAGAFPYELSGGQRQRVGVARALAPEPDLLVADEPVSSLDAAVRAQVLNLLAARQQAGLALLLIAHDLAVVEQAADRVAVLYLGRVVEQAPTARLFALPLHPYTVSLLSAVPQAVGERRARISLRGDPPNPADPPAGCAFHPRCPIARPRCRQEAPALVEGTPGHAVACFYPGELRLAGRSVEG